MPGKEAGLKGWRNTRGGARGVTKGGPSLGPTTLHRVPTTRQPSRFCSLGQTRDACWVGWEPPTQPESP